MRLLEYTAKFSLNKSTLLDQFFHMRDGDAVCIRLLQLFPLLRYRTARVAVLGLFRQSTIKVLATCVGFLSLFLSVSVSLFLSLSLFLSRELKLVAARPLVVSRLALVGRGHVLGIVYYIKCNIRFSHLFTTKIDEISRIVRGDK